MNVTVILDQRFYRTPDGTVWTGDSCGYSFFRRYLQTFDGVLAWRSPAGSGADAAVPGLVVASSGA